MTKDAQDFADDRTVLVNRQGHIPITSPLTDATPPRIEQLEERMVYAARQSSVQTLNIGLNPLVAAASELLSQVVQIKHFDTREDLQALRARLCSGLETFEGRARYNGVDDGQMLTARYLLCTVADEAVTTTTWGKESVWSQISLLSGYHNETSGGEKFFRLMENLSKNPIKHLPMLELMYVCLALGFQGRYRVKERGIHELENHRDALYRQIRHLRGDAPRGLSPHWESMNKQRLRRPRIVAWWKVGIFTMACLGVMYTGFAWVLGEQRERALQPYIQLDSAALPKP